MFERLLALTVPTELAHRRTWKHGLVELMAAEDTASVSQWGVMEECGKE